MSQELTTVRCEVCPRHCVLSPGHMGACGARQAQGGISVCAAYGRLTSVALDPIEKKPLARFMPGTRVLSMGGYGCTMSCPFCQNASISQRAANEVAWEYVNPQSMVGMACELRERDRGVVGIAYTYNEPLVAWEYVRDTAVLAHEEGLVNVLVSSANVEPWVMREVAPFMDAANIDLKGFTDEYYRWCGGDLSVVRDNLTYLAALESVHLEVTTLVVPGRNDSDEEMEAMSSWLATLDPELTYHVTRFFGRWKLAGEDPTPVSSVRHLADVARRHLEHVYVGNC